MSKDLTHGNQAIKIPAGLFSSEEQKHVFNTKEIYVYSKLLSVCEDNLKKLAASNNIDVLEYNALFNTQCGQHEKNFYSALRRKFREKYHEDQKKEFYMPTGEFYHPYNPYLQKYHGQYLRTYQEF
jgi:hypothetical protein